MNPESDVFLQMTIDADLRCALTSFMEVAENGLPARFRTLHAQECIEVILQRDECIEPLDPQSSSRKRSGSPPRTTMQAKHVMTTLIRVTQLG